MKHLPGILLRHRKHTADHPTEMLPLPAKVQIPMSMHIGAPAAPIVKKGDAVTVGQCIGQPAGANGVPVHASVSGTVSAIADYRTPFGTVCQSVIIESDGLQTPCPTLAPPKMDTKAEFLAAVRESGSVGLGGAGFPTFLKCSVEKTIDCLVVNAAECEPYLTSDCRQVLEHVDDVIGGIRLILQKLQIKRCIIGIETNQAAGIKCLLDTLAKDQSANADITVQPLPSRYPQGAEKVLVFHTTGQVVPEGKLSFDVGVLVMNVSTCAFLYRYCQTGMPLVERRITVDGDAVAKPCNLIVPIGTPLRDLLNYADCDIDATKRILLGGPMMGMAVCDLDMPIVKANNGLLAFCAVPEVKTTACIRCGRCMDACPMHLMPMQLEKAYRKQNVAALQAYHVMLCMNCGSCSFVCPAKRPLAESNQLAKALIPRT